MEKAACPHSGIAFDCKRRPDGAAGELFNKRQEERDAGLKPAGERKKEGIRAG
jgi:hypothetical protein